MIAAAVRVCVPHIYRGRFSVRPLQFSKLARLVPFAIVLALYAAVMYVPGQAVAQTCGNGTFCSGPVASPINSYSVCGSDFNCGVGTDEQSAIAAFQANIVRAGACSSSYVDLTPG